MILEELDLGIDTIRILVSLVIESTISYPIEVKNSSKVGSLKPVKHTFNISRFGSY